jgi:hypothetical protein
MKNHDISKQKKNWKVAVMVGGILFGSLTLAMFFPMTSTSAGDREYGNPLVVPPNEESFALSYGEWAGRWWQWAGWGMPVATNPITDTTGVDCALGQWGPVFFLTGTPGGPSVVRSCTIPAGKGLFFPLDNSACAVPEDGATPAEAASLCSGMIDLVDVSSLKLTIDGVQIHNLGQFRTPSPIYSFTGNAPNFCSVNCCTNLTPHCYEGFHAQGVGDGYYVMLKPLSAGRHTLHFHAEIPSWGSGATQDVTYHLNVLKGHEENEKQDK